MAKSTTKAPQFRCTECGWATGKWAGRCGECQSWGSVEEVGIVTATTKARATTTPALAINEIDITSAQSQSTGISEFDRALGGGFVPGAVLLLAGEPGVGKSTLLLAVAAQWARLGHKVLYLTGEESAAQVRLRAERINALSDSLFLAAETDLGVVLGHIEETNPSLLIVDSVQTISSADVDGVGGGVTQVKEVAASLIRAAKSRNMTTVLVGHVTKDGSVAGPRTLEHLFDGIASITGDPDSTLRTVSMEKNRFGDASEVSYYEQGPDGIEEIVDPSGLFRSERDQSVPGTCVSVSLDGRRPMIVEVQALVASTGAPNPRRGVSGLDTSRVAMLTAVTERAAGVKLYDKDVFTATIGGRRVNDPAADLAVCFAIASAATDTPLGLDVAFIGEVTLSGDVRSVPSMRQRVMEAGRLGYTRVVTAKGVRKSAAGSVDGVSVIEVASLQEAWRGFAS